MILPTSVKWTIASVALLEMAKLIDLEVSTSFEIVSVMIIMIVLMIIVKYI